MSEPIPFPLMGRRPRATNRDNKLRAEVERMLAEPYSPDRRRAQMVVDIKSTVVGWSDGIYTDNEAMHRITMFLGMHPDL